MSYLFTAFVPDPETPSAAETKEYLLEGALFDTTPEIAYRLSANGKFEEMTLKYDAERQPITLRRLLGEDAEAARYEAVDEALVCGMESIAKVIKAAPAVLEWEIERAELTEDAWFALHLWQAWMFRPKGGWLYAPGDGIFDARLIRRCKALH